MPLKVILVTFTPLSSLQPATPTRVASNTEVARNRPKTGAIIDSLLSTHRLCHDPADTEGKNKTPPCLWQRRRVMCDSLPPKGGSHESPYQFRSFACDLGLPSRNGEHDPETDGDHETNQHPGGRHVPEHAAVPERGQSAYHQDEIADQVDVDEAHMGSRVQGSGFRVRFPVPGSVLGSRCRVRRWNSEPGICLMATGLSRGAPRGG